MMRNLAYVAAVILLCVSSAPVTAQDARIIAVIPQPGTYPVLSPDARYLAYASDASGTLDLYRLDLATGEVLRLTAGDFHDSAASWSPDGTKLVFQREDDRGQRDLWEIDADGSNPRNLTRTPGVSEQHPRYSADGRTIVFDGNLREAVPDRVPERDQNYEIHALTLGDGGVSRITDWPGWDMYASLSPDGTRLVWRRALPGATDGNPNFEVFVKDLRTGEETNLTRRAGYDGDPHWSPSGDWIVFISTRDGSANIYVMRPDGSAVRPLTSASGPSVRYARPSFSFAGTTILANRTAGGVTDIVLLEFLPEGG